MNAPINKIIDFSTVDGPGLRSSIFVQKCNISCLYCHNPETKNLCSSCGKCVSFCPKGALTYQDSKVLWDKEKCINCDTCINICPNNASPKVSYFSAKEVYQKVLENTPFIRGITVSGGECMNYPIFLEELFKLAKNDNLTCLIDSNGTILFEDYKNLLDLCDGVMLDVKSWDNEIFKKLTGYNNINVKKNLAYLAKVNKIEEIRIVYVPGLVDAKDTIKGISETIPKYFSNIKLKLIKFRNNGVKGTLKDTLSPTDETMNYLKDYAINLGYKNVVVR